MEKALVDFVLGHAINITAVLIAYLALRRNQKADAKKVFDDLAKDNDTRDKAIQERHEANIRAMADLKISGIEALNNIKVKLGKLEHLDPCIDDLKNEMSELRKQFMECIRHRCGRGFD